MKLLATTVAVLLVLFGGPTTVSAGMEEDFMTAANGINDAFHRVGDQVQGWTPPERDFICRFQADGPLTLRSKGQSASPTNLRASQTAADQIEIRGAALPLGRGPAVDSPYEKKSASFEIGQAKAPSNMGGLLLFTYREMKSGLLDVTIFQLVHYGNEKDSRLWLNLSKPQGVGSEFDMRAWTPDQMDPNVRIHVKVNCEFVNRDSH